MFNNPYYNPQASIDRINNQIAELEKMKQQLPPMPQPTNLTQNFQIAPTNNSNMKYSNSLEEVQKEMVIGETAFFSKDMTVLWVKNGQGEIKTYELNEIIQKDEKDLKIDFLMAQIEELKKGMSNNERNANVDEPITNSSESEKSSSISTISKLSKKSK